MRPYRLPLEKVTEMSSKSGLEPYCMAMLVVEIKDVLLGFAINGIHLEWDSVQSFKHGLKKPRQYRQGFSSDPGETRTHGQWLKSTLTLEIKSCYCFI